MNISMPVRRRWDCLAGADSAANAVSHRQLAGPGGGYHGVVCLSTMRLPELSVSAARVTRNHPNTFPFQRPGQILPPPGRSESAYSFSSSLSGSTPRLGGQGVRPLRDGTIRISRGMSLDTVCFNAHSKVLVAALPSCGSIEFMLMLLNQIVLFGDYSHSPTGGWLTA